MPDIGGLQLLPETRKRIEIRVPGENRFLVLGFVFVLIVVGLYFGLVFYQNSISSSAVGLDNQLAAIEKSRDKTQEVKLLDLSQQLSIVGPLLSGHFVWSDAFTKIQNLSLPQIQYQSINTNVSSKRFLFEALAPSYTSIAKQIAAFYSDDSITDITLNKISPLPTGKLRFSLQLFFDPNKFLLQSSTK